MIQTSTMQIWQDDTGVEVFSFDLCGSEVYHLTVGHLGGQTIGLTLNLEQIGALTSFLSAVEQDAMARAEEKDPHRVVKVKATLRRDRSTPEFPDSHR